MLHLARGMTDCEVDFLTSMQYVIMDRDPLFTHQVRSCFASIGCKAKVPPPHSPSLNAYIERFIRTLQKEVGGIIPFSTEHLRQVLTEQVAYYNHERNHQGLDDHHIPVSLHGQRSAPHGDIVCRSRLGKTLNFNYRKAG